MGLCLIIKSGGGTDTSSATASAEQILSGYTIYKNDAKVTGSMTNVGKQTTTGLNASGSATINAGWHDGTGSVTTNSLSSQTGGTSIAVGDVLNSYTYWSSGAKATGTMTNRGTKAWTIAVNGSQTIESGWHSGSGTVKQSSTITTNSTKVTLTPTTSQQTLCNGSTYYSQERWCAGNANLTAANIKKDITIFGVKGTYYETKRYLIQNGKSTGLCTMSMASTSNVASSVTYNSETWILLTSHAAWYVDSDEGTSMLWDTNTVAQNVKAITSTSYSTGASTDVTLSFRVHGDVLIEPFNGYSSSWGYTAQVGFYNVFGTGKRTSGTKTYNYGVRWWVATQKFTIGQKNAGTMPVAQYVSGNMYKWTSNGPAEGNLFITNWFYDFAWGHKDYGVNVWVKNLWLDTTESMVF